MSVSVYKNHKTGEVKGFKVHWREGTRQRTRLFESRREADAFDAQPDKSESTPSAQGSMPFGEYVLDVFLPNSGYAATTIRNRKTDLNVTLATLKPRSVAWVAQNRREVETVLNACTRKSNESAYCLVKAALDAAIGYSLIQHHSLGGIKVTPGGQRPIVLATPGQLQGIADGLGDSLPVWCCAGLGLRACEALGLRGADFRDGFKMVRVQRQARSGEAAALKGKPATFYRDVPVPSALGAMVKARVKDQGLGALFPAKQAEHKPGKLRATHEFQDYSNWERKFKLAALKHGPYEYADGTAAPASSFTAHQLRHAFATKHLSLGVQPWKVAKWMGDTLATVERTYAHVITSDIDAAERELIDQAWDGPV